LSHILTGGDAGNVDDSLPYAHLFAVQLVDDYFAYIVQFLSTGVAPPKFTIAHKKPTDYQLIAGNLYKLGAYGILQRCVLGHERPMILLEAHEGFVGGHYAGKATVQKKLHVGIWWPTLHKDDKEFCQTCDVCQRVGKPS
jgi:hypothetical protein